MYAHSERKQALIAKIRDLAEERVSEVEDFVDFLRSRDDHRQPVAVASGPSERSAAAVQDAPDNDVHASSERTEPQIRSPLRRPENVAEMNEIYRQLVKPVEQDHLGEYVVVTPDGHLIFAESLHALAQKADHMPKTGNFLFKVGEISAAKIL